MKAWRSLAIFAIVLVVLIGVLFAVKQFIPSGATPSATPTPGPTPLLDVEESDIASISIQNPDGTIQLTSTVTQGPTGTPATVAWTVFAPASTYYSASNVNYLAANFALTPAIMEISAQTNDLGSFGLANPTVTATLRMRDGTRHVLKYGDPVPGSSGYYATLDDTGRVVVVSSGYRDYALTKQLDLLDTTIAMNGMTADNVLTLEMRRQKDGLDIQLALEGAGDSKTWNVTSPVMQSADGGRIASMLAEIVAIAPSSYVEYEPKDLAKYGLDAPRYTLFMRNTTGDLTIQIGKDADGNNAYFMTSAIPAVFVCDFTKLTYIDSPLLSLINKLVYVPNIWDVSRIDIDIDGKHIPCTLDTTKEQQAPGGTFTVDGLDATVRDGDDESYFRKFYVSIVDKAIVRFGLGENPVDTADVRIAYTLKADGSKVVLTFAKTDRDGYYVFKNGVYTGFIVDRASFYSADPTRLGLLPAYDILKNAMANAVDHIFATPTPAPTSGG